MFKRNQIMITALAIMIAVAGYLNFAGTKMEEEELVSAGAQATQEDMYALLDISDEDAALDIASLDSDLEALAVENYLDEDMQIVSNSDAAALTDYPEENGIDEALDMEILEEEIEVEDGETPGEAVYTSSSAMSALSGARLLKEQRSEAVCSRHSESITCRN